MRILWASKGVHPLDRNIAEGLAARGHDLRLFTLNRPAKAWAVPRLGPDVDPRSGPVVGPIAIRKACRDFAPDVVFANFAMTYGAYAAAGVPRKTPLICVTWGSDLLKHGGWPGVRHLLTSPALRRADAVLANARHLGDRARELGARRVEVVPYGIDTALFRPGLPAPASWPEGDGVTVVCNRAMKPLYDHETLLRAFTKVEGARLVLVGDGPLRRDLEGLARSIDLGDRVSFTGRLPFEDVPRAVAQADVWASAATSDGLPLSMLEAMSTGCKVVMAELPLCDDWRVPGAFWTFPVGDVQACADALRQAIAAEARPDAVRQKILDEGDLQGTLDAFEALARGLAST